MIPKIFYLEEGKLIVTEQCHTIPELKVIIDKYPNDHGTYLHYVYCFVHPESAYINLPEDEMEENVTYDIINTLGDFDTEEPLLKEAIKKLKKLYTTPLRRFYLSGKSDLDNIATYINNNPVTVEDLSQRQKNIKDMAAMMRSFKDAEKQADEEIKALMKGRSKLGEY